jgi:hypothetical protein
MSTEIERTLEEIRRTDRNMIATKLRKAGLDRAADLVEAKPEAQQIADRVGEPAGAPGTPQQTEAARLAEGEQMRQELLGLGSWTSIPGLLEDT